MKNVRFGYLILACAALAVQGCRSEPAPAQEAAASQASQPLPNMNMLADEMDWSGIRRIENKTAAEVGLYNNKGEVGKLVAQLMGQAKIDIKDYPVSFITRSQNGMLYTGGSKADDGLDASFFLVLRPLDKAASLCRVDNAHVECLSSNGVKDTPETLPPDVLLSIDNIMKGQELVAEGEQYMQEHNIDPYAPVQVPAPTVDTGEANPALENEMHSPAK